MKLKLIKTSKILLTIFVIIIVISNLFNGVLNWMRWYEFSTVNDEFVYACIPTKGRDVETLEVSFESFKKEVPKYSHLKLYRHFKIKIWQFWNWKDYLFNKMYKYPHIDKVKECRHIIDFNKAVSLMIDHCLNIDTLIKYPPPFPNRSEFNLKPDAKPFEYPALLLKKFDDSAFLMFNDTFKLWAKGMNENVQHFIIEKSLHLKSVKNKKIKCTYSHRSGDPKEYLTSMWSDNANGIFFISNPYIYYHNKADHYIFHLLYMFSESQFGERAFLLEYKDKEFKIIKYGSLELKEKNN